MIADDGFRTQPVENARDVEHNAVICYSTPNLWLETRMALDGSNPTTGLPRATGSLIDVLGNPPGFSSSYRYEVSKTPTPSCRHQAPMVPPIQVPEAKTPAQIGFFVAILAIVISGMVFL